EPVMRVRAVGEADAGRVERAEQDADVVARVPVITSERGEHSDPLRPQAGGRYASLRLESQARRVQLADGAEVEGVGEPRFRVVDVRSAADREPPRELERERWVDVHGEELGVDCVVAAHPSRRPARPQAVWGAGAETDPGPVTQQLVRDEESLQECHRPAVAVVLPAKGAAAN